jgi:hypothetical protein
VPFRLNRNQAEAQMREHLGRGFWRPGDLAQAARVTKLNPVYVPYWVFQATTHTFWTADTNRTPAGARGDWYPLSGEHRGSHAGLLVGASGALTPGETSALCPYDLSEAVPPEQVELQNTTVEQFGVQRKYARPLARRGLESREAQEVDARYVPGRSRNLRVNTRIEGLSSEPMLLPVWMMAYRYKDRVFRFLVNGQTGRATGQKPTSVKKIAAAVAIGIGALVLLLVLFLVCSGVLAMSAVDPRPPGSAVVQVIKPSTASAAGDLNLSSHDVPCRLGNNTFPFPRGRDILPTSSLHPFTFGPEPEA